MWLVENVRKRNWNQEHGGIKGEDYSDIIPAFPLDNFQEETGEKGQTRACFSWLSLKLHLTKLTPRVVNHDIDPK